MKLYVVLTDEESMLLDMYCAGKSALWNMFFGWRKTKYVGSNRNPQYYYRVPRKAYELSQTYAQKLGVETITG
jgi:hypothetical protein